MTASEPTYAGHTFLTIVDEVARKPSIWKKIE
jgi:hypothetical protein